MNAISNLFAALPDNNLPTRQVTEYIQFAQKDAFFHLSAAKSARIAQLKKYFTNHAVDKIYLSANLAGFDCHIDGIQVEILAQDFFQNNDPQEWIFKKAQLASCIVIINNNDAGSPEARAVYAKLFEECPHTCFIAWDWDNHHWLELSTFLAAHSDMYAPAHHENLYLLSRYNWLTAGPVYCSSVQWSRQFLKDSLPHMLAVQRSSEPLGMHIPYAQFSFRIQVISALNKHYETIGFSSRSFHVRTPADRLNEWCAHKTHWISPVLNDVPIRIFDALITGGIPIVPASLQLISGVNRIPKNHIVFYHPADIMDPMVLVEKANLLFDQSGAGGIQFRHQTALDLYHGDASVKQMITYAAEVLNIDSSWTI